MTTRLLLAALAATASLAACGSDGEDSPDTQPASRQETARKAMLDFARCMRENGVDMPDPQFNGGRVTLQAGGKNTDPAKMRAAEEACAKYRDKVKPPEGAQSQQQQEEFRQRALENARCMREHGVDMPDPQFGNGGTVRMQLPPGVDPESQKFQEAQEACRGSAPMGASKTDAPESGNQ